MAFAVFSPVNGFFEARLGLYVFSVTVIPALFVLYMLPAIIAYNRRHHNVVPITIINICFGWTFLGYVAVLAWSFSSPARYQHIHYDVSRGAGAR